MSFDLAELARQEGLRKNRVLRGIEITDTLKRDLYRIVVRPVRAWEQQVIDRIRPAYGQALSTLTRDDESDDLAEAIRIAEAQAAGATIMVDVEVRGWVLDALKWHEQRWADAVKAGTGIDVFPFIDRKENAARVKAFQSQIANLVKDVDAKTKKEITDIVWRGFAEGKPRKKIAKELTERIGIARRRANTIAVDQAQKLNGELTRIRMGEAGVQHYRWRHSQKRRFRPAHKAREGRIYKLGEPLGDEPGIAIFCGCVSEPVVDVENNNGATEGQVAEADAPATAPVDPLPEKHPMKGKGGEGLGGASAEIAEAEALESVVANLSTISPGIVRKARDGNENALNGIGSKMGTVTNKRRPFMGTRGFDKHIQDYAAATTREGRIDALVYLLHSLKAEARRFPALYSTYYEDDFIPPLPPLP